VLSGHQLINAQITQKAGHPVRTDFFFGGCSETLKKMGRFYFSSLLKKPKNRENVILSPSLTVTLGEPKRLIA
jgi:hypothetical protein